MKWVLIALALLAAGVAAIVLLVRRRRRATPDLVSFVAMRRSPRALTEADVRGMLRRAGSPESDLMPLPPVTPGMSGFAVLHDGVPMFYFVSAARPYCDNPADVATRFEDTRARTAFAEHTAWLSIDAVGGMPPESVKDEVLTFMGKVAAELMDHDSTLLFATWLDRVALPGEEAERALREGRYLEVFNTDDELNTPIVHTGSNQAPVDRAIAQAQTNYPTLLSAWDRLGASSEAMVKGRFSSGSSDEYMWVKVRSIGDDGVTGELVNEPAHIAGLRKGQDITVPHGQVVDWACLIDGKPHGLYVERVLRGGK